MHGIGNDFIVIENLSEPQLQLDQQLLLRLTDRRLGVGCDQVLVIEPARLSEADYRYRIYNADGSEVEQCGNGVRCVARYLWDRALLDPKTAKLESLAGLMQVWPATDQQVRVNMGRPNFDPQAIPIKMENSSQYPFNIDSQEYLFGGVSMGNPHLTATVSDINNAPLQTVGIKLQNHPDLPEAANVGFMQIHDRHKIELRVFERGVGETRACGSGACAAAAIGMRWGLLDSEITVSLPGGDLKIQWAGSDCDLYMTGAAQYAFNGQWLPYCPKDQQ